MSASREAEPDTAQSGPAQPEPVHSATSAEHDQLGKHDKVVRCSQGHLFTTIWVLMVSLKAVRLGNQRFQRCPVGKHWCLVEPVSSTELTDDERKEAAAHRDVRIL